jgi:hypothetical protein
MATTGTYNPRIQDSVRAAPTARRCRASAALHASQPPSHTPKPINNKILFHTESITGEGGGGCIGCHWRGCHRAAGGSVVRGSIAGRNRDEY